VRHQSLLNKRLIVFEVMNPLTNKAIHYM